MTPSSLPSPESEKKSSLPSRGAVPHLPDGVTVNEPKEFPGTKLEGDLICLLARLQQLNGLNIDLHASLADLLWGRIMTCDVPRLRSHISQEVLEWAELDG